MDDEGPDFDLQPNPLKKREGRFDTAPKAKKNPAPKAKWNPAPKAKQPAVAFESAPVLKRPSTKRPASSVQNLVELPPDDEPGSDLLLLGIAPSRKRGLLVDTPEDNELKMYDDTSLKLAAQKIPSVDTMPYDDLWPVLRGYRAVEEDLQCNLWEVYSIPRMQSTLIAMGGKCRRSFDIRHFWDLGECSFQRTLMVDLATFQPLYVMLSPPCTWLCALMHSNWPRVDRFKRVMNLVQACSFIDHAMWIAMYQHECGRCFAFEHPAASLAWDRASAPWLSSWNPRKLRII